MSAKGPLSQKDSILVIAEEPLVRTFLIFLFGKAGFINFLEAEDHDEAMEILSKRASTSPEISLIACFPGNDCRTQISSDIAKLRSSLGQRRIPILTLVSESEQAAALKRAVPEEGSTYFFVLKKPFTTEIIAKDLKTLSQTLI